jgi:hypothetical protein
MTEDTNWSVYGVSEDDSCPEDEELTTTQMPEPKSKHESHCHNISNFAQIKRL